MTANQHRARLAFFALFPLALLCGTLLEIRNERLIVEHNHGVTGDRGTALQAAKEFLKQKGVDANGWRSYCAALTNQDLDTYLKAKAGAAVDAIREIAPAVTVSVLLQAPDNQRRALVLLSLDNRVLGFDTHAVSMPTPSPALSMKAATPGGSLIAESMVQQDPMLSSIFGQNKPEVMTVEQSGGSAARRYTWRSPFPNLPDVEMELTATVRDGRLLSHILKSSVDKDAVARVNTHGFLLRIFGIFYLAFLSLVVLYSIYSYVRRAMEKEVSHSRTALVALLVSILFFLVIVAGRDDMVLQQPDLDRTFPMAFVLTLLGVLMAGAGILVGIAYGSGEGGVREAYPGKLTSLDAFVTGKVFSKNVGRAIVIGSVCASWLTLLHGLLINLLTAAQSSHSLTAVKFPYMPLPWLSFLAVEPATVIVFAVAGLLQPLAFLLRFVRDSRLRLGLLILFATFGMSTAASAYTSLAGFAVSTSVFVIGLLVPFFLFDLLTAMVVLIGFQFFSEVARITVTLSGWNQFALTMASIALVSVAIEAVAWWKGRKYDEAEVRPDYARHIAERQELQAEVSAAREAQLRLLPHQVPDVPGLSIYASCLPAKVVGGDFYDFFPLSDQRLGIFIAEGGNRGLAAALSIALAKGYLMHAARGAHSPTEVILRLESTLGSILEAGVNRTTLAYAVVDARRRTLRYARTGSNPRIIVTPGGSSALHEREVSGADERYSIHEGSIDLKVGDSIFFYTDGIARRIAARSSSSQEDWLRRLKSEDHQDARAAHHRLLESIDATSLAARHDLEDDMTAVVIRCTRTDQVFFEGVA
jgi:MFS family permease